MCLAVPMKLLEITGPDEGVTELEGTRYDVNLSLTPNARAGDYLVVHAGFAIEKLDKDEADARLALFSDMARLYRDEDGDDEVH